MAVFFDSRVSQFFVTSATSAMLEVTDYITSLDGIPGARNLNDVTTFGSVGHRYAAGLEEGTFTIELLYSEDANTASLGGTDPVFGLLRTLSTAVAFSYSPGGTTTAKTYTGNLWIDSYNIKAKMGSAVLATVTGKVDNGISRSV